MRQNEHKYTLEEKRVIIQNAKQIYREIFPTSTLSVMSGHSEMFDKFFNVAERLYAENKKVLQQTSTN